MSRSRSAQNGFTLVEIAIVLVIIGLILGGVLKGQELVTSARVRNIADQQNAIKAAFYSFQDRYRALPGDYAAASTNIPGLSGKTVDGDGDGFIDNENEQVWAFLDLSAAGFISCAQCISGGVNGAPATQNNSPINAYSGVLGIRYDNVFGSGPPNAMNNVKTGNNIPSNILAEVDNKLDDGNPYSGNFQFSVFATPTATATAPVGISGTTGCLITSGTGATAVTTWNRQTPATNCGGAYTF